MSLPSKSCGTRIMALPSTKLRIELTVVRGWFLVSFMTSSTSTESVPDLYPCDFFLFPVVQSCLQGAHFDNMDKLFSAVLVTISNIQTDTFRRCSADSWMERCRVILYTCKMNILHYSTRIQFIRISVFVYKLLQVIANVHIFGLS